MERTQWFFTRLPLGAGMVGLCLMAAALGGCDNAGQKTPNGDAATQDAGSDGDMGDAATNDGGEDASTDDSSYEVKTYTPGSLCEALQNYDLKCESSWPYCFTEDEPEDRCPYLGKWGIHDCEGPPSTDHWARNGYIADSVSTDPYNSPKYWSEEFKAAVTTCLSAASCDDYKRTLENCAKEVATAMGVDDPGLDDEPFIVACDANCAWADERETSYEEAVCRFVYVAYSEASLERAEACTVAGTVTWSNLCYVCLADPAQCVESTYESDEYCADDEDW